MSYSPKWSLKLDDVLDDTSPQLGGDLDCQTSRIQGFQGTKELPGISVGETDIGFYKPAINNLGIVTGGSEQVRIDVNGFFIFQNTSPKLQTINNGGSGRGIAIAPADAAGSSNGDGGSITLTPGAGDGSGSAGAVIISQTTAPASTTNKLYNVGGALTWNGTDLTAGGGISNVVEDTTPQLGGNLDVGVYDIVSASGGVPIDIKAGTNGGGTGGLVNIAAGNGNQGGTVNLDGGNGVGTDKLGGNVNLDAGQSTGVQQGGVITIDGGNATGTGQGGPVSISGGANSGTGNGGPLTLRGGFPTAGNGGNVSVYGINGAGTNKNGGNVTVYPGTATGSGTPGDITLGAAGGGSTVTLRVGSGAPSHSANNGSLYLRTDGTGPNLYVRESGSWVGK